MGDEFERVICVKPEVFVYKIPPRQSSRGYRAADWKLDQPDWTGRLRIVEISNNCVIKLEDKTSGELFAQAPVHEYPGPSVESVSDSSRYFVIKIQDESGRHAFIGIGFSDRGDSFDFNVSLQDHFKRDKLDDHLPDEKSATPLNLNFKDGQTIKINLGNKASQDHDSRPKPKPAGSSTGILPPPPGGAAPKLIPPPGSGMPVHQPKVQSQQHQQQQQQRQQQQQVPPSTDWGEFAAFGSNNRNSSNQGTNWVQF